MRMHVLQHVPFEGLGTIESWVLENRFAISKTCFWRNETLPKPDEIDWLTIMGGPMSVHDEREYPWLISEKAFIRKMIRLDRPVLGVCLGAQLIAEVLGGNVHKNPQKEVGWFPVTLKSPGGDHPPFDALPKSFLAFHWHGETFVLPPGARHAAESEACVQQAFVYGRCVVGLQFHIECTQSSIEAMLEHCGDEICQAPFVQSREGILAKQDALRATHGNMKTLLDEMLRVSGLMDT